ncbi:phenylalanine--tRNA ligase subunit beta [Patescibacteria group bacterium]|nr:phenylalanine--tRNA ligase subunit beta [Patescibacteria group bacterium]
MKVSKLWLDKFFDAPLPKAEALSDALTFHAFEIDGVDTVGGDEVLDVKITANRGHDCLSHRGIAKELSAILKTPFAHDPFVASETVASLAAGQQGDVREATVSVALNTPLCKRYIAAHIKGVKVGPSPKWLQERLEAIGQRSINNVVDATNFVMFNTGQPLHAFDARKLGQGPTLSGDGKVGPCYAIEVRAAKNGEKMLALDGKEYDLKESMLVITDSNEVIGLAGVKGGMPSGISTDTVDIIVESANFDGVTTRKTAAALKLRTDASSRFEQVISPELCMHGINGMIELMQRPDMNMGGEVVSVVDVYPAPQQKTYVSVTVEQVNKILGTSLTGADIADVFQRLGLPYKEQDGVFEVQPPFERLDLVIAEDLVEEVGRIIGYDKVLPVELPPFSKQPEVNVGFYVAEKVREELMAGGYSEVFTSVFAETGERTVLNKVDGVKPYLRTSLISGLNDALKKNIPNKDLLGLKEIKLFEIGTVWKDGKEAMMVGIVTEKEPAVEEPLEMHAPEAVPGQYESYPISGAQQYKPFSKYPYIIRDVAFWIPEGTDENAVVEMIEEEAGDPPAGGMLQSVRLFDRFQKADKTSLAFRLIFQSFDKTLEDSEANTAMEKVYSALKAKGFEIR